MAMLSLLSRAFFDKATALANLGAAVHRVRGPGPKSPMFMGARPI